MSSRTASEEIQTALFRSLIEQHYPSLFSYVNALTGHRDLAEEIANRVFLPSPPDRRRLLRSPDKRGWLYRRATALTCSAMTDCPGRIGWPRQPKHQTDGTRPADYRWGSPNNLDRALSSLPLLERAALLLRGHYGFNLTDAAAVLGKNQREATQILHRARGKALETYARQEQCAEKQAGATEAKQTPGQLDGGEPPLAVGHQSCEDLLPLYAELRPKDQTALDEHIAGCPACAANIGAYRRLERDMLRMPEPLHSRRAMELLYDAAKRAADDQLARQEAPARRPLPAVRYAFIGLVLVLTIVLSAWVTAQSRAAQPALAVAGRAGEVSAGATPSATGSESTQLAVSPVQGSLDASTSLPAGPLPGGIPFSAVTWLQQNQMPFDVSQPAGNPADLLPLKGIVGDARIVALSDSSFGTHELAVIKQRMTEFLVQQMGFDLVAIDSSWPQAELLNNYIQSGQGDPEELLLLIDGGYRQTNEMLDTAQWLRAHNQDPLGIPRVSLHGYDVMREYSHIPLDAVVAYLQRVDSASIPRAYGNNRELVDFLVQHRSEYMAKSSWREYYSALRNARVLLQYDSYAVAGDATQRDFIRKQYLLENVMTLLRQAGPGGKIIIWGHNQDLGVNKDARNLGALLSERLGAQYVNITLDFYQGGIAARSVPSSGTVGLMANHTVSPPPVASYEDFLHYAANSSFIVDLRNAPTDGGDAATWLDGPHLVRSIAGTYNDCRPEEQLVEARLPEQFAAVVFVPVVSPATRLFQSVRPADASCPHSPQNQGSSPNAEAWQKSATGR